MGIDYAAISGDTCKNCNRQLTEAECEIFDTLCDFEEKLPKETKYSLVYIAGYVQKKNGYEHDDTEFYYEQFDAYLNVLDRGGLCVPKDTIVQWSIFSYIFFVHASDTCRTFLMKQLSLISVKFNFNIGQNSCRTLANIVMKNYALFKTPVSTKESKLKVLKLS